ncbi:DUF896 family protein [Floricoccus penangensis]|uniref:UPF0291 protein BG262_01990 n=1 Tax=Floricoccus penangensis TaxID=1859475 RepID=A0A9Q5P069_9LACT|nr:hypothetical protein BG262_01990 [Floricoccus penangensis]
MAITDEHINRINELARKKKAEGLTPEELEEQAELRKAYIEGVKGSLRSQIEGVKVVDEEGNDVTPDKLKKVQAEKGIHGRTLEDLND